MLRPLVVFVPSQLAMNAADPRVTAFLEIMLTVEGPEMEAEGRILLSFKTYFVPTPSFPRKLVKVKVKMYL